MIARFETDGDALIEEAIKKALAQVSYIFTYMLVNTNCNKQELTSFASKHNLIRIVNDYK